MLKFYLNHRRFIVVVSFDQPPSLGPSIWRNKHRDKSLDRDINKDRDISVCLFTFIFDFVEEIHGGFVEERERETRIYHHRGVVEEASRRSTETRRDHRRGVVEETERQEETSAPIDHGAFREIERHEATSAVIDNSAIMVESTERLVSSREKMAESSREKHKRLVFRERERKKRGVLREWHVLASTAVSWA